MEAVVQLVLQAGALGLLAYLVWWATQTGAPNLFAHLNGIQVAINNHSARLDTVEKTISELRNEIRQARS